MLSKRLVQRGAPFDVGLDVENELLHGGFVVAVANDLKRLYQRDTGREHGSQLPAENSDIAWVDLAALAALSLFANSRGRNALTAQFRAQRYFVWRQALAFDARAALVPTLPLVGNVALDSFYTCGCCRGHGLLPSCVTQP